MSFEKFVHEEQSGSGLRAADRVQRQGRPSVRAFRPVQSKVRELLAAQERCSTRPSACSITAIPLQARRSEGPEPLPACRQGGESRQQPA